MFAKTGLFVSFTLWRFQHIGGSVGTQPGPQWIVAGPTVATGNTLPVDRSWSWLGVTAMINAGQLDITVGTL